MNSLRFLLPTTGVMPLLLVSASGCATIGPGKLVSSHEAYNEAVQLTTVREVLTNIVRARYADPLRFLTVSSINAQFSVDVGASAVVSNIETPDVLGEGEVFGASVGFSDSPTISFSPQSDASFYKSLYTPMEILETIGIGFTYKTDGNEYMRLLVGAINGASDRDSSEIYQERLDALTRLRERGAFLQMKSDWARANDAALPIDQLSAEGYALGIDEGYVWLPAEDGKSVRLVMRRTVPALVISEPDDPRVVEALEALGVEPGRSKYPFRPPSHSRPGIDDPYSIWISPRSVHDIIRLASLEVEVPEVHESIVPSLKRFRAASDLDLPLRIRSSRSEPPLPYKIRHRGWWFYVDDPDVESRLFLDLVVTLYSSRLGSKGRADAEPTLVLPVGG